MTWGLLGIPGVPPVVLEILAVLTGLGVLLGGIGYGYGQLKRGGTEQAEATVQLASQRADLLEKQNTELLSTNATLRGKLDAADARLKDLVDMVRGEQVGPALKQIIDTTAEKNRTHVDNALATAVDAMREAVALEHKMTTGELSKAFQESTDKLVQQTLQLTDRLVHALAVDRSENRSLPPG